MTTVCLKDVREETSCCLKTNGETSYYSQLKVLQMQTAAVRKVSATRPFLGCYLRVCPSGTKEQIEKDELGLGNSSCVQESDQGDTTGTRGGRELGEGLRQGTR